MFARELPPVLSEVGEVARGAGDAVSDVAGVVFVPAGDAQPDIADGISADLANIDVVDREAVCVCVVGDLIAIGVEHKANVTAFAP
jgi:hypothetical protein